MYIGKVQYKVIQQNKYILFVIFFGFIQYAFQPICHFVKVLYTDWLNEEGTYSSWTYNTVVEHIIHQLVAVTYWVQ